MLFYRNTGGLSVKANSFYLQSHCMLSFNPCELKWISRNLMIMPGLWPTFAPAHVISEDQPHSVSLAPPNFDLCKSVPLFFFSWQLKPLTVCSRLRLCVSIRCVTRILDSFGTEPDFNHGVWAKEHKLFSPYGALNMTLLQFYTMFRKSTLPVSTCLQS